MLLLLAAAATAAETAGRLHGTIVGRDPRTNRLTVAHDAVPEVMGAMTMSYEVRGQKVDSLPADGSMVTAMLHEADGALWLTDVAPMSGGAAHGKGGKSGDSAAAHAHAGMHHVPSPATAPAENSMTGMEQHSMQGMEMDATGELLMRHASGASMNAAAAPMHMAMTQHGGWTLMLHGLMFVSQVIESGPRGGDKLFSTNWLMGMADRPLGGGHLLLRSMLSLEPLTVGRKYPELFQTGETSGGRPIVDAQHPHDFFMEIAAEYAHPLTGNTIGYLYAAPFGDPALGPVAYPHRASASEIPQAALSHHLQDSTHIAGSVLTIGAQSGMLGYALSGFHGREPDENRWDIDTGRIDSWAARVTFDPTPHWTAQISTGHLTRPEAGEPGNIERTTASVAYSGASSLGSWDSSVVFGHNRKSEAPGRPTANSLLAESVLRFGGRNYATGRAEIVDKDELFAGQDVPSAVAHAVFRVRALTLGYSRDLVERNGIVAALGANATLYSIPAAIQPLYGSHPHAGYLFVRLRGAHAGM